MLSAYCDYTRNTKPYIHKYQLFRFDCLLFLFMRLFRCLLLNFSLPSIFLNTYRYTHTPIHISPHIIDIITYIYIVKMKTCLSLHKYCSEKIIHLQIFVLVFSVSFVFIIFSWFVCKTKECCNKVNRSLTLAFFKWLPSKYL